MTSAEWTPSDSAWRQAASTAGNPSVSTAARMLDHLPVAVVGTGELAPHAVQRRRQHPVLERRAVAQSAGLARQNRHVMPGIVDRLATAEAARMLGHDPPVLADHDPIGVGMNVDRAADGAGAHRVPVVVEADEAGLRHRGRQRVESVEAAAIRDQLRPFLFEDLPDRPLGPLRMGVRLRPAQAFVEQPGVQLVIALEPQARREEAFANEADLVLDLALLPARRRRAGHRFDEVMRAHLEEAAIVLPVLADEDRLHRRLHVVVDAARAGALEERERPLVRVEHHLLRLARIGAHEHHPAVAETDVRDLHRRRHAVQHDDLVAPVELVGLARRESQRDEGARRRARMLLPPTCRITANGGVAAVKAEPLQFLENADQRQTLARRLLRIGVQQSLEPFPPRPKPRHRLPGSLVTKLRRARANDFPHHLARNPQLAADLLDRLAL